MALLEDIYYTCCAGVDYVLLVEGVKKGGRRRKTWVASFGESEFGLNLSFLDPDDRSICNCFSVRRDVWRGEV